MSPKPILTGMNYVFARYSLEYALESIAAAGFTHLELWGGHPHAALPYLATPYRQKVRELLDRHHLTLTMLTPEQISYPVSIASPNPWIRESSVAYFQQAIDCAAELGAPRMLLTAGTVTADADIQDAKRLAYSSMHQICAYAAVKGVKIVLEPLAPEESPLINSLSSLREAFTELKEYGTEAMVDLVPLCLGGESLDDYFTAFGDRLSVIHCIDCDGKGIWHLVPGEGIIDFRAIAATLQANSFAGSITLELGAAYHDRPDAALRQAKDYLLDVFGENITL